METIVIRYAEIALKKGNRNYFEKTLMRNIKNKLPEIKFIKEFGRIYIQKEFFFEEEIDKLKKIPGIKSFSKIYFAEKNKDAIVGKWIELIEEYNLLQNGKTFTCQTKRADKKFGTHSDQFSRELAQEIFSHFSSVYQSIDMKLKDADIKFYTEIREQFAFIYFEKIPAVPGLPTNTAGKALCLLSGGIDSPAAAYQMMSRGMRVDFIHFESPPYTTDQAKEKVLKLAEQLTQYEDQSLIYFIPFTKIQLELRKKCDIRYLTLLMRRVMMSIASAIALQGNYDALITGESLGQVASQSINSLKTTDHAADILVFRPLIGMDKESIIDIAKRIGTFEISNLPYEDCCTIFVPKHPETNPHLDFVLKEEKKYLTDDMKNEAVQNREILKIKL